MSAPVHGPDKASALIRNVFVLGLDDFQHSELDTVTNGGGLAFHPLLDKASLLEPEGRRFTELLERASSNGSNPAKAGTTSGAISRCASRLPGTSWRRRLAPSSLSMVSLTSTRRRSPMMHRLRIRTAPALLVAALALALPACGADDGADVRELEGEGATTGSETGTDAGGETGTDAGGETGTEADADY